MKTQNGANTAPGVNWGQGSQPMNTVRAVSSPNGVRNQSTNAAANDPDHLLARFAIYYDVLSSERAKQALVNWSTAPGNQDFGDYLIHHGYLTVAKLGQLIKARERYLEKQQNPSKTNSGTPRSSGSPVTPMVTPRAVNPTQPLAGSACAKKPEPLRATPSTTRSTGEPIARRWSQHEKEEKKGKTNLLHFGPGVSLPNLLQQTSELGASDLHVHSGACLRVRLNGQILKANPTILTDKECNELIQDLLSKQQRKRLKENFQVDFSYEIPGIGRYRANAYQQRHGTDAVFRTIKLKPPNLAELGLPQDFERFTRFHQGLVLFTGPAGCGKSSTMAAMVDLINKDRNEHILTIEDPIEYVHESATCNVNQREAGFHTSSFSKALRAALREDPDVIVIGELRDFETISLAMTAAETGHLVLGTLHTSGAIRTVNRLLSVFPPDQQSQLRVMLSESLKVVISQHLVQRADGKGQVPALEVLVNNNATGNLIRENRTFQIKSVMQTGCSEGQCLLDTSLSRLLNKRLITKEEALKHANDPENFK